MTTEQKLKQLGMKLPKIPPHGVGNYASWVVSNNIIYTSGQFPWKDGNYGILAYQGRVGSDLNIEEGYDCARICVLNALAQLKAATKDLDRIQKIIRLDCHIQAADGFKEHSDVLDGASNLINQVFGERGMHTRSALGIYQTPLNTPILVYIIAEMG